MPLIHTYISTGAQSTIYPRRVRKNDWNADHIGVLNANTLIKVAAYTILPADLAGWGLFIALDVTAGVFAVTLPLAASVLAGSVISTKQHGVGSGAQIITQGSDFIYDGGPVTIEPLGGDGDWWSFVTDGVATWFLFE